MLIYIRPKKSDTETSLLASAQTWRDFLVYLSSSGRSRYAVFITPYVNENSTGFIEIDFPNDTAQDLVHLLGYAA